jgi:hypothetical protein
MPKRFEQCNQPQSSPNATGGFEYGRGPVSQGEKREIRKLFGAKFTAFGDLSAELERKLTPKERRCAVRLTAYESEMAALHDAAQRLRAPMEVSYIQQMRFKNGTLDNSEERHPKAANARKRPAAA